MLAGDSAGVVEVHGVASWRLALMIRLHRFVDRIPFCTWTVKQEKKSENALPNHDPRYNNNGKDVARSLFL